MRNCRCSIPELSGGKCNIFEYVYPEGSNVGVGLKEVINLFKDLSKSIELMDIADKHHLLSSIFPEKLKFDRINCRTSRINRVLDLILTVDGTSRRLKKRDKLKKIGLSLRVEASDLLSNSFLPDLKNLLKAIKGY